MVYLIASIFVCITVGLLYSYLYQKRIDDDGIEAVGIVERSKEVAWSDNWYIDTDVYYTVKYRNQDGEEVEATLCNSDVYLKDGDCIRIRYLPENPKFVYFEERED